MQPSISRGDLLLIKKSDDITIGDIITFRPLTGQIDSVTHRVVGIENGLDGISYLTKGDANTTTRVVESSGVSVPLPTWEATPVTTDWLYTLVAFA